MHTEQDVSRIVRSWLRTDEHESANRVLSDVLAVLDTTPQRRSTWPVRRIADMHTHTKIAIATAAVVVVAVLGINLVPRAGGIGAPTPIESASPGPLSSPTLLSQATGPLTAGRYTTDPTDPAFPVAATFTLPDGWTNEGWALTKDLVAVSFWTVAETYRDPCQWASTEVNLGPSVDDLVVALRAQQDRNATEPVPTTLGGFEGQLIEVDWPTDVNQARDCDQAEYRLFIAPGPGDWSRWGSLGYHSVLRIANVNGTRVLVEVTEPPGITEAQRAEAQGIVDSIAFE